MNFDVLIVGAGHGGAQAAIMLRQLKFEGKIAIIGEEPELPYERPPLSKEYLLGERELERIRIRPPEFWTERDIAMLIGEKIVKINVERSSVNTDRGRTIGFGKLIWAAGGHPRKLPIPGGSLPGVLGVRTLADANAMKESVANASSIAVVGGGYIGLEAAAALVKLRKEVVLLESLPRVLTRTVGEPLSRFLEQEHRSHGVDVRLGVSVEGIEGEDFTTGVRLASGEVIAADLVIVGIGIIPAVEPLMAAGAECGNGVVVDELCRTSLPNVYAIGDCALHRNRFAGNAQIRLESVQNANDMAIVAAKDICGEPEPYTSLPWFWSNQYDIKLQTAGLSTGFDQIIVRGDLSSKRFSIIYLKNKAVIALDCVNAMKDFVQGRKLILSEARPDPLSLSDPNIEINRLINV